ncbi:MAG TPA: XRE family transcriptional regulator [Caulobacteraceae bacterium]|jgi:transcriptional regulator with XRE-family HTH domain|nr:XRE family transcriptional regulator [Caulobacteraceae bacterium]
MAKTPKPAAAKPGTALRRLRLEQNWTLAEVSRRTGLPISTLSKVENNKLSLSYDKLVRISQGLDIDIAELFASDLGASPEPPAPGRRILTRAGEGRRIDTDNYRHLYPAAELLHKRFNPIIAEPQATSLEQFGDLVRHPGEEFALVIAGAVDFYSEHYAPVRLETGDSVYFDSNMGHAYVKSGRGRCQLLSICSATEAQLIRSVQAEAPDDEPPQRLRVIRR